MTTEADLQRDALRLLEQLRVLLNTAYSGGVTPGDEWYLDNMSIIDALLARTSKADRIQKPREPTGVVGLLQQLREAFNLRYCLGSDRPGERWYLYRMARIDAVLERHELDGMGLLINH